MAIQLGLRRYGRYTTVCQLRAPFPGGWRCKSSEAHNTAGKRWAACKGKRANLRRYAPAAPKPPAPLLALHQRRSALVELKTLWAFLGRPGWKLWCALLARAGVPRRYRLSHAECRRVMETRYRELGARQRRQPSSRRA